MLGVSNNNGISRSRSFVFTLHTSTQTLNELETHALEMWKGWVFSTFQFEQNPKCLRFSRWFPPTLTLNATSIGDFHLLILNTNLIFIGAFLLHEQLAIIGRSDFIM